MKYYSLFLVSLLAMFMLACNSSNSSNGSGEEQEEQTVAVPEEQPVAYTLVEQKPTFQGSDASKFAEWVNAHLEYPEEAVKDKIQGRVYLQMTIGADGKVRDVKVVKGIHKALDAEAKKVVSESPDWEPGEQDGKAVPVQLTFPLLFMAE